MEKEIKKIFKPFLWSYDVDKMELEKDKKRIINNILNYGSKEATDLLFDIYDIKDIKEMIRFPRPGEWNKKSLNFWSIILDVNPKYALRDIR